MTLFLEAHGEAPEEVILDFDATDDRIHGEQQGRFYHGYYDCYCYLPLYVFAGDQLLGARLRTSDRDGADGTLDELERIVPRIREAWPETRIVGRANPRFVVTSLDEKEWPAAELYEDLYCARGEMENRIKEQQLDLFADRTSAWSMRANQTRVYFSSMAYALMSELRRIGLHGTELARAQCGTIRTRLLKIGARVRVTVRRIWVSMSEGYPMQELFAEIWSRLRPT